MRDLTDDFKDQLDASTKTPIIFFEGEFNSGTLRMWSGTGTLSWNGQDFIGSGVFDAGISAIEESSDVTATGCTVWLSGIPSEILAAVLGDVRQGRPGRIWWGFLADDGTVVADPDLVFEGFIDVPDVEEDGATAKVSLTYESRLIDLERPRSFRYTPQSQALHYPGDRGFEYVASLQEWTGKWGRS